MRRIKMTYNKKLVLDSIEDYKSKSAEKKIKTKEFLETHLRIQKENRAKQDKPTQLFLRTINIYKL